MQRFYLVCAALLGFAAVALGAFAAHGLKGRLAPEALAVLQTGVNYQMCHALALLAVVALLQRQWQQLLLWAGGFFLIGTLLFSGSLYLLVLSEWRVGLVTPLGGLCFLLGWLLLAVSALKRPNPACG